MAAPNAIGTIADFDGWYSQSLDGACVPETDTCDQRNCFIDGQIFENL
jgi:hypothetical protein